MRSQAISLELLKGEKHKIMQENDRIRMSATEDIKGNRRMDK